MLSLILTVSAVQGAWAEYENPALPQNATAAYWLDRGGFLCTYGNFKAALRAYEKALGFDPNSAEAFFDMGLAFGGLGDYDKALISIDKAITLSPDRGRFHYGRGWIQLLSGRPVEARSDLVKAAGLGSREAQEYLKSR